MTLDPKKLAAGLGAEHIGQMPDAGGAFGMARLANAFKERLQPAQGRYSSQSNVRWMLPAKVPMSRETENQLILLADTLSTPERRVSPMQLAAQFLAEMLQKHANDGS